MKKNCVSRSIVVVSIWCSVSGRVNHTGSRMLWVTEGIVLPPTINHTITINNVHDIIGIFKTQFSYQPVKGILSMYMLDKNLDDYLVLLS